MTLPNNFPLTQQRLVSIQNRLDDVSGYRGVGVAGPIRDLTAVFGALKWMLARYDGWASQRTTAQAQKDVLLTYMQQAEAVLQGYAAGNWDGGAAANQLMQNMPQIP